MKEKPILMSGPMVRAILDGRKTQTRRIVKLPDTASPHASFHHLDLLDAAVFSDGSCVRYPYARRLWVKETWGFRGTCWNNQKPDVEEIFIEYAADFCKNAIVKPHKFWESPECKLPKQREQKKAEDRYDYNSYLTRYWRQWRPSIYMQRWMSRITLEVTAVRVERLQDISESDVIAEGVLPCTHTAAGEAGKFWPTYRSLWESINGPGSWDANPWVWAITFKRILP